MPAVFISYRREDSAYVAATLHNRLVKQLGAKNVFFDIDAVPFGVDFRDYIGEAIDQCDVFLAIIGERWVNATDDAGKRRLEMPADYVRIEVESALSRDIRVIPVLVDSATMPEPEELPDSIRKICFRNAAEVRAGKDLNAHIDRLVGDISKAGGPRTKRKERGKRDHPALGSHVLPPTVDKGRFQPSLFAAIMAHFPLGLGLVYLRSPSWRKWFYPLLPVYSILAVVLSLQGVAFFSDPVTGGISYAVAMGLYLLSFVEVYRGCTNLEAEAVPLQG